MPKNLASWSIHSQLVPLLSGVMFQRTRYSPTAFVRRLNEDDALDLDRYLASDPIAFIYPLGWLRREGIAPRSPHLSFSYSACIDNGHLLGATLTAGRVLVFIATRDTAAAEQLARFLLESDESFYVVVGPARGVDAFWQVLDARGRIARLRQSQVVLTVDEPKLARHGAGGLRLATDDDLEMLLRATLDMHAHETEEMPRPNELATFRRTIEYQIASKKIFVWIDGSPPSLRFKASVSAYCAEGAQVEGVWVPPEHRRRQYGLRSLSLLCQWLLQEVDVVSLYVNRKNEGALSLYRSLGFAPVMSFKTVFAERG